MGNILCSSDRKPIYSVSWVWDYSERIGGGNSSSRAEGRKGRLVQMGLAHGSRAHHAQKQKSLLLRPRMIAM